MAKKKIIIDKIIKDLEENFYDSKSYLMDLAREALNTRSKKELKQINN